MINSKIREKKKVEDKKDVDRETHFFNTIMNRNAAEEVERMA